MRHLVLLLTLLFAALPGAHCAASNNKRVKAVKKQPITINSIMNSRIGALINSPMDAPIAAPMDTAVKAPTAPTMTSAKMVKQVSARLMLMNPYATENLVRKKIGKFKHQYAKHIPDDDWWAWWFLHKDDIKILGDIKIMSAQMPNDHKAGKVDPVPSGSSQDKVDPVPSGSSQDGSSQGGDTMISMSIRAGEPQIAIGITNQGRGDLEETEVEDVKEVKEVEAVEEERLERLQAEDQMYLELQLEAEIRVMKNTYASKYEFTGGLWEYFWTFNKVTSRENVTKGLEQWDNLMRGIDRTNDMAMREYVKENKNDCKKETVPVTKGPGDRLTEILAYIEKIHNILGDSAGTVLCSNETPFIETLYNTLNYSLIGYKPEPIIPHLDYKDSFEETVKDLTDRFGSSMMELGVNKNMIRDSLQEMEEMFKEVYGASSEDFYTAIGEQLEGVQDVNGLMTSIANMKSYYMAKRDSEIGPPGGEIVIDVRGEKEKYVVDDLEEAEDPLNLIEDQEGSFRAPTEAPRPPGQPLPPGAQSIILPIYPEPVDIPGPPAAQRYRRSAIRTVKRGVIDVKPLEGESAPLPVGPLNSGMGGGTPGGKGGKGEGGEGGKGEGGMGGGMGGGTPGGKGAKGEGGEGGKGEGGMGGGMGGGTPGGKGGKGEGGSGSSGPPGGMGGGIDIPDIIPGKLGRVGVGVDYSGSDIGVDSGDDGGFVIGVGRRDDGGFVIGGGDGGGGYVSYPDPNNPSPVTNLDEQKKKKDISEAAVLEFVVDLLEVMCTGR